jgi:CRISPR-associated protein Csm4
MYLKLTAHLKSGVLSSFQSDTTMGIFCWRLKHLQGEEKLKEFIEDYQNGKPAFTISNEFFEINDNLFFPPPIYVSPVSKFSSNKKDGITAMLKNKENKSLGFISIRQLNAFLSGDLNEYSRQEPPMYENLNKKKRLIPGFDSELRVGVQIDRVSLKSKEGQLFSYHPKFLKEGNKLTFLIKVISKEHFNHFNCEAILKEVFEYGYGKKKSSGYGHCTSISITEFNGIAEPDRPNGFITLGNYLPSNEDGLQDGTYDTFVKYGRLGEEYSTSSNPFKKPMLMIKGGSVFYTSKQKEFYGRVTTEGEVSTSNPFAVQFGIPFTLKFKGSIL